MNEADGQQFLLTRNYFYFKVCLAEDKKFYAQGTIECKYIDSIRIESEESECTLKVNEVAFAAIKIRDTYKQDFIIFLIVGVIIIWSLYSGSQYGKMVLFLGAVALLAYIGSWIIPFVIYISYGAIILILILLGVMLYKKLFG